MPRYASGSVMKEGTGPVTVKASAAETTSTTHTAFETPDAATVYLIVDVTAASGTTPTMTIVVEGSVDNATWFELGTIGTNYRVGSAGTAPTNLTTTATSRACFPATQFVRTRSVIAGTTPSFTYSILAELN